MSITISALRSSSMRRSVSRRSWRFSSAKGSRLDLGPRFWGANACRTPASRSRRQVANRDEYRPSRRSSEPILPVPLAWSAADRICSLYSAVKRRRLACATTSGSGWVVVLPPVALRSPSLRSGSLRPTGGNTTEEEEAGTWLFFTLGDSFSPCSLIKRREVSHSYWHGGERWDSEHWQVLIVLVGLALFSFSGVSFISSTYSIFAFAERTRLSPSCESAGDPSFSAHRRTPQRITSTRLRA